MAKIATKQNGHFGSKIKNAKEHAKSNSTRHCSCSMQKTAQKTANIRKMRPFWKLAKKAIAFAKWSLWVKSWKSKKKILKTFLQDIPVVLCKKQLEKTAIIRKMRPFWKLA